MSGCTQLDSSDKLRIIYVSKNVHWLLGKSCHSPSEPLQASVGEHFSLNCSITEGSISWLYNNIPLKESQDISTSLNGVLKIFSVKLEHAGWYTCTAGDETGRQEADYLLIVIVGKKQTSSLDKACGNETVTN